MADSTSRGPGRILQLAAFVLLVIAMGASIARVERTLTGIESEREANEKALTAFTLEACSVRQTNQDVLLTLSMLAQDPAQQSALRNAAGRYRFAGCRAVEESVRQSR